MLQSMRLQRVRQDLVTELNSTELMEYYSTIKKSEIGSFVKTWSDLETVIQSEVS